MYAVGIITEYNPFHEGHVIHLNESRRISGADVVVCVMSPDFVQRGEPAIIDKYSRAKMAVLGGADLVVELPTSASLSSAEGFAESAVGHLSKLGVTSICFGSEDSDADTLSRVADTLLDEKKDFKEILKSELSCGNSYATARQKAVAACIGEASAKVLEKPNNLLGIEYIKAVKRYNYDIHTYTITRTGAGYNETDTSASDIQSASAIRLAYMDGRADDVKIPESTRKIIDESGCFPVTFNDFGQMFYYRLEMLLGAVGYDKSSFIKEISKVADLSEETAARIYSLYTKMSALGEQQSLEKFALSVKTKQFALSRIKRNIMRFVLGTDIAAKSSGEDGKFLEDVNFIRILGFTHKGQEYISSIKEELSVPVITNVSQYSEIYADEIHAHNIYRQVCLNKFKTAPISDYAAKPFIH